MSALRRSIAYAGSTPLLDTLPAVRAADKAGLDGIWSAEHVGLQDALVPSVAYAMETTQLEIGLVGLNPDTRSPGVLAMELATLAALAPGRVRVQVGTGSLVRARRIGVTEPRTVRGVETFVGTLRRLLAGEQVTDSSEAFALDGMQLSLPPAQPIPIDVMAVRPRMLDLAARVGDGVSLSVGASREYLRTAIRTVEDALARDGRARADFRISAVVAGAVGEDIAAARRQVAASWLVPFDMPVLQVGVALPEREKVDAVLARDGVDAAVDLYSDEVIDQLGLAATPQTVNARLDEYHELGVDEVVVMTTGEAASHKQLVDQLGATVRGDGHD